MKIGILGGTFDPVHLGHLRIAEAAMEQAGLEQVLFIPAGHPRLKQTEPGATVAQRIEMVCLAIEGHPKFRVCEIEAHRPGPTYTVDTLVELSGKLGPEAELFFILGLDVLGQLDQWKEPERVPRLCRLLALDRPGEEGFDWPGFYSRVPEARGKVQVVTAPLVDVSGTELRRLILAGEPLTGQVPEAVARYIQEQGLYQNAGGERKSS
ncbi:MAG: nicotinate-nucleotide adenylyltransferase [Chloroflexi bacterium]|nr:nicotinate-nucleotide adenylyltransferase [Chloroflexota bacterium]